jgi:hypothetical protein
MGGSVEKNEFTRIERKHGPFSGGIEKIHETFQSP